MSAWLHAVVSRGDLNFPSEPEAKAALKQSRGDKVWAIQLLRSSAAQRAATHADAARAERAAQLRAQQQPEGALEQQLGSGAGPLMMGEMAVCRELDAGAKPFGAGASVGAHLREGLRWVHAGVRELAEQTPDEVWVIVTGFLDSPRDLGRLKCAAKRFRECVIKDPAHDGEGGEAERWSVVEEGARLQAQRVLADRERKTIAAVTRISVTFTNGSDSPLALHWVQPDGSLDDSSVGHTIIGAGEQHRVGSAAGHEWSVLTPDGDLLLTIELKQEDGSTQTIDISAGRQDCQSAPAAAAVRREGQSWLELLGKMRPVWKAEALMVEGEQRMEAGEFEAAVATFKKASRRLARLIIDPDSAEIQTALVELEIGAALTRAHLAKAGVDNKLALVASAAFELFEEPSAIVSTQAWAGALAGWLERVTKAPELRLLYRASHNGWSFRTFTGAATARDGRWSWSETRRATYLGASPTRRGAAMATTTGRRRRSCSL